MSRAAIVTRALFSRRWWWVTLLVVALMLVLARLGIWQLDRLEERRASNAQLRTVLESAPLALGEDPLPEEPELLENRLVTAAGVYDLDEQVLLKLQNWQGRTGAHLVTPLVLGDGETAVLIDRGWIPDNLAAPAEVTAFDITDPVTVEGYARLSETLSRGVDTPPDMPQREWYRIDIANIQRQVPYDLLPIYVLQSPPPDGSQELPFRASPEIDLSEGSHLSYAVQWFIFSVGLGIAYVIFVNKQTP